MTGRRQAIIIAARRTAIGKLGGLHRNRTIERLAAPLIPALLSETKLDPEAVDEVILGNAAGGGGNPARLIALAGGLPASVPAMTIDRQCASGLDAVAAAARLIQTGAAEAIITGGAESPSTAPWRVAKPASLYGELPRFFSQAAFAPKGNDDPGMVEAAENIARQYHISRERQDAFALESHRRAVTAQDEGRLDCEILPLAPGAKEGRDEAPRAGLSEALLARVSPLLGADGTVTAGNSCQINDGAALLLLVSGDLHKRLGCPPGMEFVDAASAGVDPAVLGIAAVPAFEKLKARTPVCIAGLDVIELNEAFAAQVLATADLLTLPIEKINGLGGALAYGHPYGASGAILVVRLFTQLVRNTTISATGEGLAMIAAAGGVGTAALFRKLIS